MTDKELIYAMEQVIINLPPKNNELTLILFRDLLHRFRQMVDKPSVDVDEIVEAIRTLMPHEPSCNINACWAEVDAAMADTPEKFRDANWYASIEEINRKRAICTCKFTALRTVISSVVNK